MSRGSAYLRGKVAEILISTISSIVFLFLDFLDVAMCLFYRMVDEFMEGKPSACYCAKEEKKYSFVERKDEDNDDRENELSETLRGRRNFFKDTIMALPWKWPGDDNDLMNNNNRIRWSDCGCESCSAWITTDGSNQKLHVVVKEPGEGTILFSPRPPPSTMK